MFYSRVARNLVGSREKQCGDGGDDLNTAVGISLPRWSGYAVIVTALGLTCLQVSSTSIWMIFQQHSPANLSTPMTSTFVPNIGHLTRLKLQLQPSACKTGSSIFHLHNARAKRELNIFIKGQRIKHDPKPTYLGITLDCSLTYHDHLKKTAAKISSQNNLLCKLAGTSWGARA